ncbi:MAG: FxsA family protein, partial [Rhodospirillales bacterium]
MVGFLFILLLAVPIIEIALFIEIGGLIGVWPTIGIVIATAIAGA